jgi:hypothetical protein
MSIAIHKEFIREINVEPAVRYTIFNENGTVSDVTQTEARFLYNELGELLKIDTEDINK